MSTLRRRTEGIIGYTCPLYTHVTPILQYIGPCDLFRSSRSIFLYNIHCPILKLLYFYIYVLIETKKTVQYKTSRSLRLDILRLSIQLSPVYTLDWTLCGQQANIVCDLLVIKRCIRGIWVLIHVNNASDMNDLISCIYGLHCQLPGLWSTNIHVSIWPLLMFLVYVGFVEALP